MESKGYYKGLLDHISSQFSKGNTQAGVRGGEEIPRPAPPPVLNPGFVFSVRLN